MTVLEACAIALAISAGIVAVACVVGLVTLWRARRRVEAMSLQAYRTLVRLGAVAGELEAVAQRAQRLEKRVHRTAERVLDELEPALMLLSAGMAAVRAGLTSWVGSRREGSLSENGPRKNMVPQKGEAHEQHAQQ